MDKKERYRQVFLSFKGLCAAGNQPCSFSKYCREHGVDQAQMRQILGDEFQNIKSLHGYKTFSRRGSLGIGAQCARIYETFKKMCAEGKQPGTFKSYYLSHGITPKQMDGFQRRNKLKVVGLPGFVGPAGTGNGECEDIPFEDIIFEEAGFLPAADATVITVNVDSHVAVRFPADTDVAVIAKFIRKMGKEAVNVES